MSISTACRQVISRHRKPVLLALMYCCSGPVLAVDNLTLNDPVQQALYEQLTREIRCPDCQNQSLADSQTPRAANHRREIRDLIIAGFDEPKVKTFLVERYGEDFLYEPRFRLATALLWLAPALFFGLALVTYRRAVKHPGHTKIIVNADPTTPDISAADSPPSRTFLSVLLIIIAITILTIYWSTNENIALNDVEHLPGILITLALICYSVGVWSERIAKRLKSWHLIFFWSGVVIDSWATALMASNAGGLVLNLHGLSGALALMLMVVHAIWATGVLARNNKSAIANFHRFSVGVWAVWLIPYVSGLTMAMR